MKLPYGNFIIEARSREGADVVLIAGGTGISPFVPYLEGVVARTSLDRRVVLYYGVRSLRHLLFRDLLASCNDKGFVGLRVMSEAAEAMEVDGWRPAGIALRPGRLDPHAVLSECTYLKEPVFFLSGPPAMMDNFRSELAAAGIPPGRIQIDQWE